jgi:predicted aspartyl protease
VVARHVVVRPDLLRLHVLGIELQHLCGLVVDPDHGMEHRHRRLPRVVIRSAGLEPAA